MPVDVFDEASRLEREMDREMNRVKRHMGNMLSNFDQNLPLTQSWGVGGARGELPFDFLNSSLEHYVEGNEKEPGKYIMNVPLGKNIGPQDLKVNLKDNIVSIEAKKDRHSDDNTCRVYQEYSRKFTLPPHVNMKEVTSTLTPDGYLKFEAPVPLEHQRRLREPKKPVHIPIQQ